MYKVQCSAAYGRDTSSVVGATRYRGHELGKEVSGVSHWKVSRHSLLMIHWLAKQC